VGDKVDARTWKTLRLALSVPFWLVGVALTIYLGFALFGFVRSSSEHYASFMLAIVLMTGLLAVRNLVDARLNELRVRFFGARMALALIATLLATIAAAYIRYHAVRLESIAPFFEGFDLVIGFVLTVGILLLTLIHWGPVLTSIVTLGILYFFYGHHIHSVLFTHPEYQTNFVMNYIGLGTTQGFFWLAQLASDSIYFLILYAAILLGLGMLRMVIEVGKVSGRHVVGGAAFPALIGSGVVASVMGQAVSNVVLTGRFTIPMMKDYGYRASMAGAIEATASSSGQIMPPVLGLAGFIIASFLNQPYIDIALAALIPGLLFLSGVTIGVLVYARRYKLPKLHEPADTECILRLMPTFLVSFVVVLVLLLNYYSPSLAGMYGIMVALALCMFQGKYRPNVKEFVNSFEEGLTLVAVLSLLLIAIGPLGQVMLTTNLSGRLGTILIQVLPDTKLVLLIGAMIVSLLLGMGLPTPVAYIVVALAVVPFMQQLGVPALQAHFFVFYFAVFSTLTPPVAVSVLAAAKLAGAGFLATAADSMKLAATTFIIPFAFVYDPQLMSFPHLTWSVVPDILEVLLVQWACSLAAYGYFRRDLSGFERWIFVVISLLGFGAMIDVVHIFDLLFFGSLAVMMVWIYLSARTGKIAL
jgi:TRAP transporter 4TM/12TM fusion protein